MDENNTVICSMCYGDGYIVDETDPIRAIAQNCPLCEGRGQITIKKIDDDE